MTYVAQCFVGVRMSNLGRQEANTKKQSTITEMFASRKGSPRKHKIPVDSSDSDVIPAKRPRLEETEVSTSENQVETSVERDHASLVKDVAVSEVDLLSESADSEATDIYWPPKENGFSANQQEMGANTEENKSEGSQPGSVDRPDSRSTSSDEYFARPQPVPFTGGGAVGTKARDTPTTKALIKAQGSQPISCPVCSREFKSRNMTHITNHIDRCLKDSSEQPVSHEEGEISLESKNQEEEVAELFEDEGDELFSSRESQILLSQDDKEQEENVVEIAADECEKVVEENIVENSTQDVPDQGKVEEGESETTEAEIVVTHDKDTGHPDIQAEVEEGKEASPDISEAQELVADTVHTTSDKMISEMSDSAATTQSEQVVQDNSDKEAEPEGENTNMEDDTVKENGVNAPDIHENGLHETAPTDMFCPVCNTVQLSDLRLFNIHVDRCLKKQEESGANDGTSTIMENKTSEMPSSGETSSDTSESAGKGEGGISYLKNITPRRPLRTGPRKNLKSPSGGSSTSTLVRSSPYAPIRSTVSCRATHTSVTKVCSPEVSVLHVKF